MWHFFTVLKKGKVFQLLHSKICILCLKHCVVMNATEYTFNIQHFLQEIISNLYKQI